MFNSKQRSSSWLDKLRSSKGIPVNNDLNLEQFLSQNPNSSSDPSISISNQTQKPPQQQQEDKWFSNMSNVLAELFVMEGDRKLPRKKASRKQSNPKVCIFPSQETKTEQLAVVMSPSSVDNNSVAEDNEKIDLSGYSRSDLMIIDTSSVVWKTEKLVLRKGSVWKVRERDSKSRSFPARKKKRKLKQFDDESEDEKRRKKKRKKKIKEKKKKKLMLSLNPPPRVHSKGDEGEECGVSTFKELPENGDLVANKQTQRNLDRTPIKRCKFFSSHGKLAKKSSGLHMKRKLSDC